MTLSASFRTIVAYGSGWFVDLSVTFPESVAFCACMARPDTRSVSDNKKCRMGLIDD